MDDLLPIIYLARHGETAWSLTGQYNSLTDLPLTGRGDRNAKQLGKRLQGISFIKVYTSPLQQAVHTCQLAGFGAVLEVDDDLVAWNYGDYEGRRGSEIRAERPDWNLFRDGCPHGESAAQVVNRADRVVNRLHRIHEGNALLFSSGHFMRVLAACWIGLDPAISAPSLMLSTASLSALGYEDSFSRPVIRFWNDTCHVEVEQLKPVCAAL